MFRKAQHDKGCQPELVEGGLKSQKVHLKKNLNNNSNLNLCHVFKF